MAPTSNSHISVLDPWRVYWSDLLGPSARLRRCFQNYRETMTQSDCQVCQAWPGGPRTPWRTVSTERDSALVENDNTDLWLWKVNRIKLVVRPGLEQGRVGLFSDRDHGQHPEVQGRGRTPSGHQDTWCSRPEGDRKMDRHFRYYYISLFTFIPRRRRKQRRKPKLWFVLELMHDEQTNPTMYGSTGPFVRGFIQNERKRSSSGSFSSSWHMNSPLVQK